MERRKDGQRGAPYLENANVPELHLGLNTSSERSISSKA